MELRPLRRFPQSYILNDDKPALFLRDGRVYAAGTPFSGKYDCSVNESVPLRLFRIHGQTMHLFRNRQEEIS